MKKIFFLFFILTFEFSVAQQSFKTLASINVEADFFTTDNQSNVYAVHHNELVKYNKSGKELYRYSTKNFGNISFVDASNMLKILVYYKDFSQVVFLDNTLSLSGEPLSLDKIGFQQAQLACTSHNNGLWVYDQQNFSLVQLNSNYEKVQQTPNINNLLNIELMPDAIVEYDNKIYINNPETGILIFDIYGTYYKTIPVKKVISFEPMSDWVYYQTENSVKAYNIKTTEEKSFDLPVKTFLKFRLELGMMFIQTADGITIYGAE
jgi:hypothetical protein